MHPKIMYEMAEKRRLAAGILTEEEQKDWDGNDKADSGAKQAVGKHDDHDDWFKLQKKIDDKKEALVKVYKISYHF